MPSRSLAVRQKLAVAAQKRPAALLIRCLFFSDLDDLTALVIAARRAGAIGLDHFSAMLAGCKAGGLELAEPLCFAIMRTGVGYSPLGCCHLLFPPLNKSAGTFFQLDNSITKLVFLQYYLPLSAIKFFKTSKRGSRLSFLQPQGALFRFAPHCGQTSSGRSAPQLMPSGTSKVQYLHLGQR